MRAISLVIRDMVSEGFFRRYILALVGVVGCFALVLFLGLNSSIVQSLLNSGEMFGGDKAIILDKINPIIGFSAMFLLHCSVLFSMITIPDLALNAFKRDRVLFHLTLPIRRHELIIGIFCGGIIFFCILNLLLFGTITALIYDKFAVFPSGLLLAGLLTTFLYAPILSFCMIFGIFGPPTMTSSLIAFFAYISMFLSEQFKTMVDAGSGSHFIKFMAIIMSPFPNIHSIQDIISKVAVGTFPPLEEITPTLTGIVAFTLGCLLISTLIVHKKDF